MQHVVVDPSENVTAGSRAHAAGDQADPPWDPAIPEEEAPAPGRAWTGRLFGSVLLAALVLVSASALAAVTMGATGGGHEVAGSPADTGAAPAAAPVPRLTAYAGDPGRFSVTVEDARTCALPAGVTGPTADGRVRFVVTGTSSSGTSTRMDSSVETLADLKVYYSSPDDLLLGFSPLGSKGLADARSLDVAVECRTAGGAWAPAGSTGPVALPPAGDRPAASVSEPLTTDSQVTLTRAPSGKGRLVEASVDGLAATIIASGEDDPKVLLPSGTGPGAHLLNLRFDDGAAALEEDGLTVPIVNGYAPPSSGAGQLSDTIETHGVGLSESAHAAGPANTGAGYAGGFEPHSRPGGGPGGGPGAGSVVLGWMSLLLLAVAGSLIWTFHRLARAT